jgi:hypothetical protein
MSPRIFLSQEGQREQNGELREAKRLGRTGAPKTAIRFVSFLPI